MIELTPEQRQALEQQPGEPVRVVDPATRDAYVLLRAEVYERLAGVIRPPAEEASQPIAPAMLRAQQAFWRDLPELLKNRRNRGKWVAYHGDGQVGLDTSRTQLYHRCLGRGLQRGEFYVARVAEREAAPWEPTPLERSLYEMSDEPLPDHST